MTTDSPSACAPSLFVGAVGLATLSAASLASRRALKRAVLARSAFRSAIYSAMAWAPSVARSDFLNCVSAHLRSFESSVKVWLLWVGTRFGTLAEWKPGYGTYPAECRKWFADGLLTPKRKDPSQIDEMLRSRGSREDAVQRE
jgi:hypothetical protein